MLIVSWVKFICMRSCQSHSQRPGGDPLLLSSFPAVCENFLVVFHTPYSFAMQKICIFKFRFSHREFLSLWPPSLYNSAGLAYVCLFVWKYVRVCVWFTCLFLYPQVPCCTLVFCWPTVSLFQPVKIILSCMLHKILSDR